MAYRGSPVSRQVAVIAVIAVWLLAIPVIYLVVSGNLRLVAGVNPVIAGIYAVSLAIVGWFLFRILSWVFPP